MKQLHVQVEEHETQRKITCTQQSKWPVWTERSGRGGKRH